MTLLGGSDFAVIPGGGGGLLLYDRLLLMAYACSLGARTAPDDDTRKFSLSGLGGQLAWVFAPSKRLHGNVAALLGNTSATITAKGGKRHGDAAVSVHRAYAEVEASLYFGLKLFAGGGYRILAGGGKQAGIDSRYLRGPTLEFGFRMGS